MAKVPRIAESEWKVMKVLWAAASPMPAYDIIEQLSSAEHWHPKTVRTLLGRLIKKRALGYKKYKNLYLYYPKVSEAECIKTESAWFLDRCFGGSLRPMLAYFVHQEKLSPAETEELKNILKERSVHHDGLAGANWTIQV